MRRYVAGVLIGREAERATIGELIERARAGGAGTLVLSGEAGIGKTALLEYAVGRAEVERLLREL